MTYNVTPFYALAVLVKTVKGDMGWLGYFSVPVILTTTSQVKSYLPFIVIFSKKLEIKRFNVVQKILRHYFYCMMRKTKL